MDYIHEIWKSYSPGEFFWNIVGGILTTLIFELFKKPPAVEGSIPRMKIESIGESVGCMVAIFSFFTFIFIYVFKQDEILRYADASRFLTLKAITDSFLLSYGIFLFFRIVHGIREILNNKLSSSKFLEGIILLILYPALCTLTILYVKISIESANRMSQEQIESANQIFKDYWVPLFQVIVICFSILIFGTILKIIKSFT